jgi:adenosine kinase
LSLSFLVEDLDVRRGGVAANIAFGMALPGPAPRLLVGAVGQDFETYTLLAGAPRRGLRLGRQCPSAQ